MNYGDNRKMAAFSHAAFSYSTYSKRHIIGYRNDLLCCDWLSSGNYTEL